MKKFKKSLAAVCLAFAILFNTASFALADDEIKDESAKKPEVSMERIDGRDRFAVANKVMKNYYRSSKKVILVSAIKFPDNISSTVLSQGEIPILYTYSDKLDKSTEQALKEKDLDEVIIVGGEKSVSKEVENNIQNNLNVSVKRYSGKDRYEVNSKVVAEKFEGSVSGKQNIVIASGQVYADAINATSLAQKNNAPIVLVSRDNIYKSTKEYLSSLDKDKVGKIYIVGGQNTVSENTLKEIRSITGVKPQRISGSDRYITSVEVARASFSNPDKVIFASGEVFVDALVAAPLSQKLDSPIILVQKSGISSKIREYLGSNAFENMYIIGGINTIPKEVEKLILNNKEDDEWTIDSRYPGKKVKHRELPGSENEPEYPIDLGNDEILLVRGHYDDKMSKDIFNLLNNYRIQKGLKKLKEDKTLAPVAKTRAVEIVHLFDHERPTGGVVTDISNINGENIYNGPYTAEGAMQAWKESPGHNENMLRKVFTRVNVKVFVTKAYYEDSNQTYDRYYAVQIFGI